MGVVVAMAQLPNLSLLTITTTYGGFYDEDYAYDNAVADDDDERRPQRRQKITKPPLVAPGNPDDERPPQRRQKITKPPLVTPGKPPPPPVSPAATDGDLTIPPGTRVHEVNWRSIMRHLKKHDTKSFNFTVHAQKFDGGHVWEMKMRLERALCIHGRSRCTFLTIQPTGAPTSALQCVSISLSDDEPGSRPLVFEIDSLFYDIPKGDYTNKCRMAMLQPKDWDDTSAHLGQGAIVLELTDVLAPLLDTRRIKLIDAARFAPDSSRGNPDVFSSNLYMTSALALLRGYGYYEARGWFSNYLIQASLSGNSFNRPESSDPQRMIDHAHADLLWTEVVMTTPTKELYKAILDFPTTLSKHWRDWSPYPFEKGLSDQYKRFLYSDGACQKHADRALKYINAMLVWCKGTKIGGGKEDRDESFGRWMDEFDKLSIRDIRKKTMAKLVEMDDSRVTHPYDAVPEEHHHVVELIGTFLETVWSRRIYEDAPDSFSSFIDHPDDHLEKIIFNGPDGRHQSLKIVVDKGTGQPNVVLVDNRSDFTCESSTSAAQTPVFRTPRLSG